MTTKITVPVEIKVPDGFKFDSYEIRSHKTRLDQSHLSQTITIVFKKIEPKKVIDLSCIVGSGIDCEFSENRNYWSAGSLHTIKSGNGLFYPALSDGSTSSMYFKFCRIRQSPHVHWWKGGDKCPLPDGLKLKLHIERSSHFICSQVISDEYMNRSWGSVIGFEVLGVAEGWRYEWEEER